MFRGAIILALGYISGYTHAASRNEQVTKAVQDLRKAWTEAATQSSEGADTAGETSATTNTTEGEAAP